MTESEQLSSLATHLYVRLRRDGGRVIDVMWMMRNQEYAREVIRVARSIPDPEIEKLADRIEQLMFGVTRPAVASSSFAAPRSASATEPDAPPPVPGRYRGGLR